jgi:hypothetical protein
MSCFDRVKNVYHLVLLEKYRAPLYFVGTTSRTNCNNAKNVGDATRPKLFGPLHFLRSFTIFAIFAHFLLIGFRDIFFQDP